MTHWGEQNRQTIAGEGGEGENTFTHLCIVDVMHLVENNEFDVTDEVRTLVKHAPENLGSHDQAACLRVDLDIACQDSNSV